MVVRTVVVVSADGGLGDVMAMTAQGARGAGSDVPLMVDLGMSVGGACSSGDGQGTPEVDFAAREDGAWARSWWQIVAEVDRVIEWQAALAVGSAWRRRLHEDFGLGMVAAVRWTLALTDRGPMSCVPARVRDVEVRVQGLQAWALAEGEGEYAGYGFGVLCWLQWLTGGLREVPYPDLG